MYECICGNKKEVMEFSKIEKFMDQQFGNPDDATNPHIHDRKYIKGDKFYNKDFCYDVFHVFLSHIENIREQISQTGKNITLNIEEKPQKALCVTAYAAYQIDTPPKTLQEKEVFFVTEKLSPKIGTQINITQPPKGALQDEEVFVMKP